RPDLPVGPLGLSELALFRGDYEAARKHCEDARGKYKDNPQPLMLAAVIEFFSRHFDAAERLYQEACLSNREGGGDFLGSVRFLSALGFIRKHAGAAVEGRALLEEADRKSTRLNSSHVAISYAVFCLKKKKSE